MTKQNKQIKTNNKRLKNVMEDNIIHRDGFLYLLIANSSAEQKDTIAR